MYTSIMDTFWTDTKNKLLSQTAKLLFIYLLTCRHRNIIGFYRLPCEYMAADLNVKVDTVRKGLVELFQNGQVAYDEQTSVVLIVNFLKYNPLQNANQQTAAINKALELGDNPLTVDFLSTLKAFGNRYERVIETVARGYAITVSSIQYSVLSILTPTPSKIPASTPIPEAETEAFDANASGLSYSFSETFTPVFEEWLQYKKERKQSYKPTGLSQLAKKVQDKIAECGETAVANVIRETIANNWQGIVWDKMKAEQKPESRWKDFD